jgi:hypothetical protein
MDESVDEPLGHLDLSSDTGTDTETYDDDSALDVGNGGGGVDVDNDASNVRLVSDLKELLRDGVISPLNDFILYAQQLEKDLALPSEMTLAASEGAPWLPRLRDAVSAANRVFSELENGPISQRDSMARRFATQRTPMRRALKRARGEDSDDEDYDKDSDNYANETHDQRLSRLGAAPVLDQSLSVMYGGAAAPLGAYGGGDDETDVSDDDDYITPTQIVESSDDDVLSTPTKVVAGSSREDSADSSAVAVPDSSATSDDSDSDSEY